MCDKQITNAEQESATQESPAHRAALQFLFGRIDYERITDVPYEPDCFKLDRMRELLEKLGNPQDGMPIIHIAGTKGKGSTSAMLAAILTAAGISCGVYSSPHLDRIEERVAVDSKACSSSELVDLIGRIRPVVEAMDAGAAETGPTYFEISTAMALLHFADRGVGAAILEVGLGGRLDSTNVCSPKLTMITSISFDHTKQLGNTLAAIAGEKAGIVKPGVPLISGVSQHEPRTVIREICQANGSPLIEFGGDADFTFDYQPPQNLQLAPDAGKLDLRYLTSNQSGYKDLELNLLGRHQASNGALAVAAADRLRADGWDIPTRAVRNGLASAACPARVEVVSRRPTVVIDTAHNRASIEALVDVLGESFSVKRRLLLFAATQEKDLEGMLGCLLGFFDEVVFTKYLNNPRAVEPEDLAAQAERLTGRRYRHRATPPTAWDAISSEATSDDLICITGSFFIAAEMRRGFASANC